VRRTLAIHAAILFFFAAAAVAMTWPLAPNLSRAIAHPGDPFIVSWILDWEYYALTHAGAALFHGNIFHPLPYSIALSENMLGILLVMLPLFIAGAPILIIYNTAVLAGYALSGYAMAILGRHLTRSAWAGVAAGVFFTFVPWRFSHLTHLQHLWALWLPLLVLALLRLLQRPTLPRAVLFALPFVLNGLTNLHWLAFGSLSIAGVAALCGFFAEERRRYWKHAFAAMAAGTIALLPLLLQYWRAGRIYKVRGQAWETLEYSARPSGWLIASLHNRLYGPLTNDGTVNPEHWAFPGLLGSVLAIAGLIAFARRAQWRPLAANRAGRAAAALAVITAIASIVAMIPSIADSWTLREQGFPGTLLFVALAIWLASAVAVRGNDDAPGAMTAIVLVVLGFLGSLGLHGAIGKFLFDTVPLFRGIRAPARWAMIAYLGMAMLVAYGAASLPRRRAGSAIVTVLFLLELRAAPIRWYLTTGETPAVYSWLQRQQFDGAILELPMAQQYTYESMYYATLHHRPLINGVSGSKPPAYERLESMSEATPVPPAFFAEFQRRDGAVIIHHEGADPSRDAALQPWLRDRVAAGQLRLAAHFPRNGGADSVYMRPARIHSMSPRAGDVITGELHHPVHWEEITGALDVHATIHSSTPIAGARLYFDNRRTVIAASVHGSTIRRLFAARPPGIRADTDLQVEVTDARGRVHALPQVWLRWRNPGETLSDAPLPQTADLGPYRVHPRHGDGRPRTSPPR
jgi:hypothetical protein